MTIDKITIFRKDTKTYNFTLKRSGSPIDLNNYVPRFTAKEVVGDSFIFDKAGTITTASEGTCSFLISSADTANVYENAAAEIVLASPQGHTRETLEQFYLTIRNGK